MLVKRMIRRGVYSLSPFLDFLCTAKEHWSAPRVWRRQSANKADVLGQKLRVDVGEDSTLGDDDVSKETVELLIVLK
jgi:hypothetical protein